MKYKWILPETQEKHPFRYDFNSILLSVMQRRGIRTREELQYFLDKTLNGIHDPFIMKDMDKAVKRILDAITNKEKILIYGDYDVDGVTSIAILTHFFRLVKTPSDFYIPHRIKEGYGLSEEGINFARENRINLIITVDTGINNHKEILIADESSIDVIVTDHHKPPETLPRAVAILNPSRSDCPYPNKNLAGVGVAFKLVHACLKKMKIDETQCKKFLKNLLDFVTLGTIADLVSLTGENRKLVATGLKQISQSIFPGIRTLIEQQLLDEKTLTTGLIAFRITPKLNASGRTDHGKYSARLLIENDPSECINLYAKLDSFNRDRQSMEEEEVKTALSIIENNPSYQNDKVLIVTHPSFHGGVNGIVASKLVEKYHKPAIVFSPYENGYLKGSARSIKDISILECISQCRNLCVTFGGHSYAAGLTIEKDNINTFREHINKFMRSEFLNEAFEPRLYVDAVITLSDITKAFVNDLKALEPFGLGNPEPVFLTSDMTLATVPRMLKGKHVKFEVSKDNLRFEVIGFNLCNEMPKDIKPGTKLNLVYKIGINNWLGQERIQLEMMDCSLQ